MEDCRINPREVAFFFPANLTKTFAAKVKLFMRMADYIEGAGGRVIRGDIDMLARAADDGAIPVIGCTPQLRPLIERWCASGRTWVYWDRGYFRRGYYLTWLPKGDDGGYYRWHINRPQMGEIYDVPDDRWKRLQIDNQLRPWNKDGKYIVIIDTPSDYWNLWDNIGWVKNTAEYLRSITKREIRIRDKESKIPLYAELERAHCLVAHGSNAAIESVVFGCPVFVDRSSAAALVGQTDFASIETPVYPERQPWLNSISYCQFTEREMMDGTLWKMIR